MKRQNRNLTSKHVRPLKAVAIVLAILLIAPGVEVVARIIVPMQVANAVDGGIDSTFLTGGEDAFASLERIESVANSDGAEVPESFSDEIGFLPGARDVRVSDSGVLVVGYVVVGDCSSVAKKLDVQMENRGWSGVALGETAGATYAKSRGFCTWVLATCTQVGDDTSVVMRCVIE